MKKILSLLLMMTISPIASGNWDLDDLDKELTQEVEEKKQEERRQAKQKAMIADCEQALSKLKTYKKSIGLENLVDFTCDIFDCWRIVDFASDGVFIAQPYSRKFIYTKNKNYINEEIFNPDVYYKESGVYRYTTITGATNSVEAYKPTNIKISDPKLKDTYYTKDKSITSCSNSSICYKEKVSCFKYQK